MTNANDPDRERCAPKVTGLAAEVEQLIALHSKPRREPERFPVPNTPGVYSALRPGDEEKHEMRVQLDTEGRWWPYPFIFSGWRASELSLFVLKPLPELASDVPEIPNPEKREAVERFAARLLEELPGVSEGDAERFARKLVLEEDAAV